MGKKKENRASAFASDGVQTFIAIKVICNKKPDPAPNNEDGKKVLKACNYYQWRHDNFIKRHKNCDDKSPPTYYIDYGLKYCNLFKNETRPILSEKGKIWLDKAKINLQEAMEKGLKSKRKKI